MRKKNQTETKISTPETKKPLTRRDVLKIIALLAASFSLDTILRAFGISFPPKKQQSNPTETPQNEDAGISFNLNDYEHSVQSGVLFEGLSPFGTEIYSASSIQELSDWYRQEELAQGIDVTQDEAFQIRDAIEAYRSLEPRKMIYLINDTLWNEIIATGQYHIGTNNPAEAMEAYMHVQNQMLNIAGIASEVEISAIIHLPDSELNGSMYTYGAATSEFWNPISKNRWVNIEIKNDGTQFTLPPLHADQAVVLSGNTSPDWFLCRGFEQSSGIAVTIEINGVQRTAVVRGDLLHESTEHTLYKASDLYYENFDIAMITDPEVPSGPKVLVYPECNMANLHALNLCATTVQDIKNIITRDAQKEGTPNHCSMTHGLGYMFAPYLAPEFSSPIMLPDSINPRRADFIFKYNNHIITDQISKAYFFPTTADPGIEYHPFYAQNPDYGSGTEPQLTQDAVRFDQWALGGITSPHVEDQFVINIRAFCFEIGNYKLPIIHSIYKYLGKDTKQYEDNNRVPVNTITLIEHPDTFQMPDLFYIQVCQGFKPPVNPNNPDELHPSLIAHMKLDTKDNFTYVVWTKNPLTVAELNTFDEADIKIYFPTMMKNVTPGITPTPIGKPKVTIPQYRATAEQMQNSLQNAIKLEQMYPKDNLKP